MTNHLVYSKAFNALAVPLGLGRGRTRVAVDVDTLRVRMGWAFQADIPLSAISRAREVTDPPWYWSVGAHVIGKGRWVVNGTLRNLVEIDLQPPVPARSGGFDITLRSLIVSVEDPAAFISGLQVPGGR